jgi:N-acetylmuramoyl-L-alanine amidase
VLRKNVYPAILGEACYLSNIEAERLYQDPSTIRAEAEGYFEAIRDFFDQGYPEIQWLGVWREGSIQDATGSFEECPIFAASVTDTRSGMCPDGIEVSIDSEPVEFSYSPEDGRLTFTASGALPSGTHAIRIVARNNTGRYGHALEQSFSIRTEPAAILLSIEPHHPAPPVGGILRLTVHVLDKNGIALPDGESVDLRIEGGEILKREPALKEGRLLAYLRTQEPEIKISASCGSVSRSESWLTSAQGEQYCGWTVDEKTGEPVANARLEMAGRPPRPSDRMGWFSFDRLQADTDLDVEAEGYWPKRLNTGPLDRPVSEFVIKMRPLFGGVLQGKSIILDPEFGGMETGQIGEGGLRACDVNLAAARLTRSLLQSAGAKVELTREDDRTLNDVDRVYFGLARDFDWFITLRHAEPRPGENEPPDLNVSRAYAKWDDARQMAEVFPKYMQELMGTDGADTKNCSTWEVMHASNRFQAIGLSPLFMTAPGAARRLEHQAALRKEAQSVLFGLIEYFTFQNADGLLPPTQPGDLPYSERLTQQTGAVSGIVTDASRGAPLGDVLVGLEDTLWTGTESDGRFLWRYLDPGQYRLTFSRPGYRTTEVTIALLAGEKREIKAALERIQGN